MRVVLVACIFLSGCVVMPPDAFTVPLGQTQERQLETRRFDGANREQMYAASAAVLQDMGFTLTQTQSGLGLLVGTKDRSAVEAGQVIGAIFVALLGGGSTPIDKNQRFFASVVVLDVLDDKGQPANGQYSVRATFARKVWNTQDKLTRAEQMRDAELYSGFFEKLSKSVFLEAHNI